MTMFVAVANSAEVTSTAGSELSPNAFGITVRFVPDHAGPGDVVQLRAEMDRDTWGQFELHVPANPDMHAITVEELPLQYKNGRYQQQQSLVFQPKRSGSLRISGATIDVVSSRGRQTVTVPDLTLAIKPFESTDTATTPVPLPSPEPVRSPQSPSRLAVPLCIGLVLAIAIFLVSRNYRNQTRATSQPTTQPPPSDDLVDLLKSGQTSRQDLEQLLNDPNFVVSATEREVIERAVYAENCDTTQLANLLQQQETR
ncbi:hypothetical protein RMSM_03041 [Rhodopirellula maiorica SM1]|uniref:Uncharacterized protein n=2 Tax=Novipirellula TaxID=2795426 RepID=M5RL23_9BACT|nr:hypothetical protein RMSM_03041 [Rhodopirellula maiorica SM1]